MKGKQVNSGLLQAGTCLMFFPNNRLVSCYEDKIIYAPDTEEIYFDIVNKLQKYDDISFTTFVEYVIAAATKENCFERSSNCWINPHFR